MLGFIQRQTDYYNQQTKRGNAIRSESMILLKRITFTIVLQDRFGKRFNEIAKRIKKINRFWWFYKLKAKIRATL